MIQYIRNYDAKIHLNFFAIGFLHSLAFTEELQITGNYATIVLL